ncbi:MAG: aminotransferase class III-fold pyridoxal phosphate-dependent enzyme [Fuerstiella sp.]|nr:aminotransferase class III-fold pyridoxal phosphate-dependent enzyme [Fuerstiella sp.]
MTQHTPLASHKQQANGMNNQQLYERARQLIPGGTQLLSKRPEMFAPDVWPAYYREAKGCEIVDLDGRRFVDMSTNCVGACLLGYANEHVDRAVQQRVQSGSMCTLNSPDEVELAELLTELHPWADMVRYARAGGEALSIAVRIARAATRRDQIAFCGYHGWSDWYLAANLSGEVLGAHLLSGLDPAGVPRGLEGTVFPFQYGDLDALREIVRNNTPAAIVMEPFRQRYPEPGFLEGVRQLADESGTVLVIDEVSSGWKFHCGGAHMKLGIEPDMAVFAKTISNGYPMSAVIGRSQVMDAAQTSFISSTYWTDGIGPAAAIATIRQMQQIDVPAHLESTGARAMKKWTELGQQYDVPAQAASLPAMSALKFDHPQQLMMHTLFTSRMLDHGYLAGSGFFPTLAHTEQHVDGFIDAAGEVFTEIRDAIVNDDLESRLKTPVRQTGFQRLT